jgi:hypothetical protein
VRDNGDNGFEVHSSSASFKGNAIHNNSRSTGWRGAQMLFFGPAPQRRAGVGRSDARIRHRV